MQYFLQTKKIYKCVLRDSLKYLNKWKDILTSQSTWLSFAKMLVLTKLTYRFNEIAIKIPK